MAETQVRVGIIGCGVHAREVLLPAAQQAGMEFAAVCDLDRRLAQRVSRRFGAFRAYQDIRSMIDEMDLDAVLVCGPPEMHAEAAAIALQHRCHLWTEMPAAPTAEEAERLAGLADAQGLIAQPGLMLRYAPACMRLRELVAGEEFGAIRQIEVAWWPPEQHAHDDAPLFDLPHALDLVRFIGGEVTGLSVARAGSDGSLAALLALESGAVATVSFASPARCPRERIVVASEDAVAIAEDRRTITLRHAAREDSSVWSPDRAGAGRLSGILPEMEAFAAAIAGEGPRGASLHDAARAMRLGEMVRAGLNEGLRWNGTGADG